MTSALPPVVDDSARATMDLERQYLLQNYTRYPLVIARGKGCYVYDTAGRRYLDFLSGIGVNALGHAHPRIVKVIREQAGLTIHCSNLYYNQHQGPLAKRLAEISGLQRTFFANSGAEPTAMRFIRRNLKSSRSKTPSTGVRWAPYPSPDRRNTGRTSNHCFRA